MPHVEKLPTRDDGVTGLLELADTVGVLELFRFINYVRGHNEDVVTDARAIMAARLVRDIRVRRGWSRDAARREAADLLGYAVASRPNFYKMQELGEKLLLQM